MGERITAEVANKILRKFRGRFGTRGSRIHQSGAENNLNRKRALDGICGNCEHLRIYSHGWGKSKSVQLYCEQGINPVSLYEQTPVGQQPHCDKFSGE